MQPASDHREAEAISKSPPRRTGCPFWSGRARRFPVPASIDDLLRAYASRAKAGGAMDGRPGWVGAGIECRVRDVHGGVVELTGHFDRVDSIGDGMVRVAGEFATGSRFVLVTDDAVVAEWAVP